MIKNVTPLLKNIILSFNKSKEPTIRNILFIVIYISLVYNIWDQETSSIFLIFIALLSQKQILKFFDYRLRTFYLSVWLGHIIVDQKCLSILKKMNAFPEKFTFQFE